MQKHKLYTFMFEFRGGTYIGQVEAFSIGSAVEVWAKNIDENSIEFMGRKLKEDLILKIKDEEIGKINCTKNVWIMNPIIGNNFSTIHIIETRNE